LSPDRDPSRSAAPGDDGELVSTEVDVDAPQAARRYDYWLGGKDNFAADRRSADEVKAVLPAIEVGVRENRAFLRRAVRFLAAEYGIRQFLDIGVGMPATPNVHEVAQAVHADARVVYVDHDPVVAVHARALLTGTEPGVRVFVPGDLRRPRAILDNAELGTTLRLDEPIGLLLTAVLHFVDDEPAYAAVRQLVAALPPGSCVVLSHASYDALPPAVVSRLTAMSSTEGGHGSFRARTRAEIARFLEGLDAVDPGLVWVVDRRPDLEPRPEATADEALAYGAVARIP
jgi:hypothetical protein